jgi:hypothetical protein
MAYITEPIRGVTSPAAHFHQTHPVASLSASANPRPIQKPQNYLHSLLLIKQPRDWLPSVSPPYGPDVLLNHLQENPDIVLLVHTVFKQILPCLLNVLLVPLAGVQVQCLNRVFEVWRDHGMAQYQLVIMKCQLLPHTAQFLTEM